MIRVLAGALLLTLVGSPGGTAPPNPPGVGVPCDHDRACPGYLRCEGGACAVPPALTGVTTPATPRVIFDLGGGRTATLKLEICDDPYERSRGMMFRERMAEGWGMLFLFRRPEVHRFWMKNTLIPLDMLFLGEDGTVTGIVERARPLDRTGRGVPEPSLDVLELPGGAARKLGIRKGAPYRYVGVARPVGLR